jgi:hypothetical protein
MEDHVADLPAPVLDARSKLGFDNLRVVLTRYRTGGGEVLQPEVLCLGWLGDKSEEQDDQNGKNWFHG